VIPLSEVQASLSLFAEALVGQPVTFATIEDQSGCWPWSDEPGEGGVVLPATLHSRASYRTVLLHQLLKQTGVGDELVRAPSSLYSRVFDLVENHRVTAEIRRSFPGASSDLGQVLQDAVSTLPANYTQVEALEPVDGLLRVLRLHTLGALLVPDEDQLRRTAVQLFDQARDTDATGGTSERIAGELMHLLEGLHQGRLRTTALPDPESDPEGEGLASEATTGVSLDGGTPNEVVDGDRQGGGQLSSELGEYEQAANEIDDTERLPSGLKLLTVKAAGTLPAKTRTFVYDEWDYHSGQHRPAWCRVIEERLVGDDHEFIADVRHRHQALRMHIRRRMLQLPAQHLVRVHRSLDGDELDLDAAIEAVVDRRSGAPVDDRLQIRRDRAARDVATVFLVDLSASTSSPSVPPEPEVFESVGDPMDDPMSYEPIWDAPRTTEPVRRVIDVAKDAVALMADALHELGDTYAVYGFSGTGRDNVEFKIGKDFGDRASSSSWASIAAMRPLRYTRMGPAVRHAAAKLGGVAAQTKLLIVVSDGYPQDTDYGRDRNDRDYGMHDTARALRDATNAGIETFCVTIDPAGHDYLREMCPDGRYLVIDDVESLPAELAKLYLLTMGVE
jgi:nitric oxide reductase NorD protein